MLSLNYFMTLNFLFSSVDGLYVASIRGVIQSERRPSMAFLWGFFKWFSFEQLLPPQKRHKKVDFLENYPLLINYFFLLIFNFYFTLIVFNRVGDRQKVYPFLLIKKFKILFIYFTKIYILNNKYFLLWIYYIKII